MTHRRTFLLWVTTLLLLGSLLAAAWGEGVRAAPEVPLVSPGDVVISEFRTTGPNGANDEFIEIINRTNSTIQISNWKIRKSSGCGTTLTDLVTIGVVTPVSLAPGQHFLVGNIPGYLGNVSLDLTYSSSVADDGGLALVNDLGNIIDQVGMCSTTTYLEGAPLAPLSGTANQSYERKNSSCTDTNDNSTDFIWNQTSSNPQNLSSVPIPCLRVTNVTSATPDGTYVSGNSIAVTVTFSSNVDVIGSPTLLLETGVTERNAIYSSGSGTDTLTFAYTVMAGDTSGDLDYVATNSLSLNGGTITGAAGNASLVLPSPGAAGSLSANKAIVIDNQVPPILISFTRQVPSITPTNAVTLTFRVTFSEAVTGVGTSDFVVHSNTPAPSTSASVTSVSPSPISISSTYDVTISGGDLASLSFNGVVGLDLSGTQFITDMGSPPSSLPAGEPAIDDVYNVDYIFPTVTINQEVGQADPASGTPVNFAVVFSEPINVSTFTTSDIAQSGTIPASLITWSITDFGDHMNFTLSATSVAGNGTLIPSLAVGKVADLAGNPNTTSTSSDNTVVYNDTVAPTVTVNQAAGQPDPASTLPISFTVVFSEPIIASIFTTADITQSGTATGITWSITDSGDHQNFTLSATAVTGIGTLIPSIAANRVTDISGNNNIGSTSTDNTVTHVSPPAPTATFTVTRTSTRTPTHTRTSTPFPTAFPGNVALNEYLPRPASDWNGDGEANSRDEYIELINMGTANVNIKNWKLDDIADGGSSSYTLPDLTLAPYQIVRFYASETGISLSDGGDTVRLIKPDGRTADLQNYTIVSASDRTWCRLPDGNGAWLFECRPTPGRPNARLGSETPAPGEDRPEVRTACRLPDTVPLAFQMAECDSFGGNIWKHIVDWEFWLGSRWKWDIFVK